MVTCNDVTTVVTRTHAGHWSRPATGHSLIHGEQDITILNSDSEVDLKFIRLRELFICISLFNFYTWAATHGNQYKTLSMTELRETSESTRKSIHFY